MEINVWWLGALAVLGLLVWAFTRTGRTSLSPAPEPAKARDEGKARSSASSEPKSGSSSSKSGSSSKKDGRKSKSSKSSRRSKSPPTPALVESGGALPSLVDTIEDDAEITLVTASPQEIDKPKTSTVSVSYEEDADLEEVTSPISRILVFAEGQSDQGLVRKRNEDSLLVFPERSVFVVADGMGGHKGGNIASSMAVDTMKSAFERSVFDGKMESGTPVPARGLELACSIQMANQTILARAKADPTLADMGTTVVAARFSPNKQRVYIGHVGDSRCYRIRGAAMRQLTSDHTMAELGVVGRGAGDLFQAVGVGPEIIIDVVVDKPRVDDIYLLCSDGLTKMAKDHEIRDLVLDEPDLEAAVYGLIELANDRGGKDNVTVILIKIMERDVSEK